MDLLRECGLVDTSIEWLHKKPCPRHLRRHADSFRKVSSLVARGPDIPKGRVIRFDPAEIDGAIPHMGWNQLHIKCRPPPDGIPDGASVYCPLSIQYQTTQRSLLNRYGGTGFVSASAKMSLHPLSPEEKSGYGSAF
jgi:imidazoleglycerol phosphate synthase glutamine amidotransferase subunit HisH